ncbi:hypothetical protein PO78_1561 [Thauera sp. SWB20]|nr:hypothetical protein PO78_1561 [Thauera sp. SWB20]
MLTLERGVDHHAGDALREPLLDQRPVRGNRGLGRRRQLRLPERGGDLGVLGQGPLRIEPALGASQLAEPGRLAAPHQFRARDLALGIALAHAHQGLAVLVHLDAPAGHRLPPAEQKGSRIAMDRSRSRRPSEWKWLHYADPALASMCRSATGSNMPITDWPQCADHAVAPLCRSSTGSNVPVGDRRLAEGRFERGVSPKNYFRPRWKNPRGFCRRANEVHDLARSMSHRSLGCDTLRRRL